MISKKDEKIMPAEVAEELTQIERLVAHIENGYALYPEDRERMELLSQCFRIIYDCETPEKARRKLTAFFDKSLDLALLVDETTLVFGDFFKINKDALRIIQEKRHLDVYRMAMQSCDYDAAERALGSIDKLYLLYDKNDKEPYKDTKLPIVRRSSDPEVFRNQQKRLMENADGN